MSKTARHYLRKLEVPRSDDEAANGDIYLSNHDLLPIPKENRIWGKWTYSLFWFGECASVTSWTVAATGVKAGLSWWEAWLCVIFGHLIVAIFMTAIGRAGAVYHLGFPTIARSSFGVFGSLWPIFNRDAMTIIWTGVQGVTAGNSIYVMLHAIFPSIAHVPNPFRKDVTMTGGRLIGYVVGWFLTLFCAMFQVHKFRNLIMVKSVLMLGCLFAFFIWTIVEAKGVGPVIHQGAKIPAGQSHTWIFLTQLFIQAANFSTFATNNSDLTRYATRANDALWTQIIGMPVAFGVVGFFGIFVTSSSQVIFGEINWDPNGILDSFLTTDYSPSRRAGVFFIALGFSFAQVTTQIFANLIAAGNDTAALLPRYVNIRRGAVICLVLSFAITPWNLLKTSFTFTSYLGSYQIFLSSIIGVILSDYFLVRRGHIVVQNLFTRDPNGLYWYNSGINWRAYAAYITGIIPCLPGFLFQVGVKSIPLGARRLYVFALPIGIIVSGIAYAIFCHISPPPGMMVEGWHEDLDGVDFLDAEGSDTKSVGEGAGMGKGGGEEKVAQLA
ncbi:Fc.00g036790.m01.CDS01 [Cosmosporella sp. VM-42]